jgi:aldose 1-epimerase
MQPPPSGEQFEIAHGDRHATIVEVGGGIREYAIGGRDVLHPYPLEAMCDGAHGAPLIPWPNRLADGRYSFVGAEHQLALTEPAKRNAIHGLLRWRSWRAVERLDQRVVMGIRLHPMTGWPFALEVSVTYALADDGLTVETRATNVGDLACPWGSGQHPYLAPGEGAKVDDCTLQLAAGVRILTDPERQLPIGRESVEGTDYDFHSARQIGSLEIDHAFTDLERDADGRAWLRIGCPDGRTVQLWSDQTYPLMQVYTADTLAPGRRRTGLGAEPMSCPPNALGSGELIVRLEPGESHLARWGVRLG